MQHVFNLLSAFNFLSTDSIEALLCFAAFNVSYVFGYLISRSKFLLQTDLESNSDASLRINLGLISKEIRMCVPFNKP